MKKNLTHNYILLKNICNTNKRVNHKNKNIESASHNKKTYLIKLAIY